MLYYILAIVAVVILAKLLFKSMKIVTSILVNALIGGIILWILNLFGFGIAINWLTAILVGALGVPGVIIVLVLHFLL